MSGRTTGPVGQVGLRGEEAKLFTEEIVVRRERGWLEEGKGRSGVGVEESRGELDEEAS